MTRDTQPITPEEARLGLELYHPEVFNTLTPFQQMEALLICGIDPDDPEGREKAYQVAVTTYALLLNSVGTY